MMLQFLIGALLAGSTAPRFGDLGRNLEEMRKSSFFEFFHLQTSGEKSSGDLPEVRFQPSGEQFHDLVRLYAKTTADGRLRGVRLLLARPFIEGGNAPFAADIAKSFLQAALTEADKKRFAAMIEQIETMMTSGSVFVHPSAVRTPSGPPAPGYEVYLGARERWRDRVEQGVISIQNHSEEGQFWFEISLGEAGGI